MPAYFFSLIFYSSQHPHELRSYRKRVAGPGSKCRKTDFRAMLLTPLLVGWMNGWMDGRTDGQTDGLMDRQTCELKDGRKERVL